MTRDASRTAVIPLGRRTPIARSHRGDLAQVPAARLAAACLSAVVDAAKFDPSDIDDVILGQAVGDGGLARLAALEAGFPVSVPGLTVDRQCGSGLEAVLLACRMVQAGAGACYLAGGAESPSTAPFRARRPTRPGAPPRFYERARFAPDALGDPEMIEAAENVAQACGVTRARQDALALASHVKAVAAERAGRFNSERVSPREAPDARDDGPRADADPAALAALPPLLGPQGTVTAGNACAINDGAAALLVLSLERARSLGFRQGLVFRDACALGCEPKLLGLGPVAAGRRLFARQGLTPAELARVEFNEAFAAQVLGSLDALGFDALGADAAKINPDGGAIALGHPFGASGALLVLGLLRGLTPGDIGLTALGIGGGMGITALFGHETWG